MSVDETLMCSFKKIKPHTMKKNIGGLSSNKKMGQNNFGKKYMAKFSR